MQITSVPPEMEFRLLGPLAVRSAGVAVPVTAGRQRAVLAALLLSPGQTVGLDELAEVLWGARPPRTARISAQNYVMRLRQALGEAGRARIGTLPGGYAISVADGELDVSRFEALIGSAQAADRERSWATAAARAGQALALWRGEPLADAGSELLASRHLPRLTELRLTAAQTRAQARLNLGLAAAAVPELRQLAAEHPLRERVHGLLMMALHADGQTGEALAAYQRARQVLVAELGTEPGPALRELQQRILAGEPVPGAGPAAVSGTTAPGTTAPGTTGPEAGPPAGTERAEPVPHQLPARVQHFTGRSGELAALTGLLDRADREAPGTVLISAIGGTAGVGKTALAVTWAHRVAGRFGDGQLYVNLRGYDARQPVPPADALAGFLRALGVAGDDIPAGTEERAARYRSLLAGRRMLVVLDNAGSAEQVRPLLPGSSALVVVTSRDPLPGLVARDGAARLDLGLLTAADAAGLLTGLIGERAGADPATVTVLARLCGRLPLALRLAAELAIARPATSLASLAAELAGQRQRLDLLDAGGDRSTAVRSVFSWSTRHLDAGPARAFRLTGLPPGADFDVYDLAALAGCNLAEAGRLLDRLARAYLIQPGPADRYSMHDLLRAYARELSAASDTEECRRAALTRLFDHYLYTAAAAMDTLRPWDRHQRPHVPRPTTPGPPVAGTAAAKAWLDAQRASLVAMARHAAECGWPRHATGLAAILLRYLEAGGHLAEARTIHSCARTAARRAGDRAAEAAALTALGCVAWRQDHYQRATTLLRRALTLFRQAGDQHGEARALMNLGLVATVRGSYQQADGHYQRALTLYRQTGDVQGEAGALRNLSVVDYDQGRYQQAHDRLQRALALCRDTADQDCLAGVLDGLGSVELRLGHYPQAARHLEDAVALCRGTGNRMGEAEALGSLGDLSLRQGRYQRAADCHQRALDLFRESGDRANEAAARNGLGEVLLATGRPGPARAELTVALGLLSRIGDQHDQARTHRNLGHACLAAGDLDQARHHWQEAVTRYDRLGTPEADQVRASLRDLPPDSPTSLPANKVHIGSRPSPAGSTGTWPLS